MLLRPTSFLSAALCVASLSCISIAQADTATLYLLSGVTLRGEIVARSPKTIQLKTPSGIVIVRTSKLMPISRQQLKLPDEADKDETSSPEMEAVLAQMEKLLAENEALKAELETLKSQLAKTTPPDTSTEPKAYSESTSAKK